MFSSEAWLSNSSDFYNGVATQSLRFDDGSSAYLSRTPSSAGNRKTFVFSAWIKRGALGGNKSFFGSYFANDNNSQFYISFNSSDKLVVSLFSTYTIASDAVFRDISSWYHVVVACDVTQSTDSNRWEVYVNGQEITFTGTYPPNADTAINSTNAHYVGHNNVGGFHFDGYMAEVNFIDGLSFFSDTSGTPNPSFNINSFGELKNSVWIPIKYTGSYGTNGFRLQFNQTGTGTGSTTTVGADTSGVSPANHWDSFGIDTEDCAMPDSPENGFATLNPLESAKKFFDTNQGLMTHSEGNLKFSGSRNVFGNIGVNSGKWYWEVINTSSTETSVSLNGVITQGTQGEVYAVYYNRNGNKGIGLLNSGATESSYGATYTDNDIIGVALNMDDNQVTFFKNNASQGTITDANLADGDVIAWLQNGANSGTLVGVYNFGQDSTFAGATTAGGNTDANGKGDFKYSVPSGYLALCTANLPEPTISPNADTQADDYFNTVTYTGNGTGQSITGVGFQADWTWIKRRSAVENHWLTDSVRGVTKGLISNSTNAEATRTDQIQSFDTDGFTLGNDGAGYTNISGNTYVAWNWKAGGTAVSNTDGSITSSVSANTDAGFSIVTYTGTRSSDGGETGTPTTIGHGLGKKPAVVITKAREAGSAGRWNVWHQGYQPDQTYLNYQIWLNQSDGSNNAGWQRTDTGFSTTTFCPARYSWDDVSGVDFVAYCFAEIEGYSKFGSYTGNGSDDGTFVYTGFRPAFLMAKVAVGATGSWNIFDNTRDPFNEVNIAQVANSNAVDDTLTSQNDLDFVSNGFKIREDNNNFNGSGHTFIYMAFAENPFKYANAR